MTPGAKPSPAAGRPATPAEHARRVIARTASAWRVPPASAREVERRAPHGYVPVRVLRRMRMATAGLRTQRSVAPR